MEKNVGIFCRNGPNAEWRRLKARNATIKDVWDYQRMFPDKEVARFEYGNGYSSNFDVYSAKTMRRVA